MTITITLSDELAEAVTRLHAVAVESDPDITLEKVVTDFAGDGIRAFEQEQAALRDNDSLAKAMVWLEARVTEFCREDGDRPRTRLLNAIRKLGKGDLMGFAALEAFIVWDAIGTSVPEDRPFYVNALYDLIGPFALPVRKKPNG